MKYTKKDLKKMLKEKNINKTSNNKMSLMLLAVENNLIDKNEWMEDVKEERPVGRPKKGLIQKYLKNSENFINPKDLKHLQQEGKK